MSTPQGPPPYSPKKPDASVVRPQPKVGWILFATILASSMAFIDGSALNVALPTIQADLGASGVELLWIVNAYLLFLSSLILVGGALGDRYGRRRIFALGTGGFGVASAAAGLAPSGEILIGARAVQGVGGALMVPGSLAIISASIPAGQRGAAIGSWSAFTSMTTILGPLLGGFLASAGLWRGVFFINLPLAALVLLAVWLRVPETKESTEEPLDLLGTALVTLSLAGLTFGAVEAPRRGLADASVLLAWVAGAGGMILFLAHETRTRAPMVPLRLFKSRIFSAVNLSTFLLYAGLNAAFFFFSLALIQAQGYQPRQAGLALVPFALLLTLLSRWAGRWVDRSGPRWPLIIGPALTAGGFLMLGLPDLGTGPASYWTSYLPGVALVGGGMGITVAPLTTTVMNAVPQAQVGVGSGVNNAIARVAGVLAIAVLGGLALLVFRQSLTERSASLAIGASQRAALIEQSDELGEAKPPRDLTPRQSERAQRMIEGALLETFRLTTSISAALAALSSIAAAVWVRPGAAFGSVNQSAPT